MSQVTVTFGRKITLARRKMGVVQSESATLAKIDRARYSQIENNRVKATESEIKLIAKALGLPEDELIALSEQTAVTPRPEKPVFEFRCRTLP